MPAVANIKPLPVFYATFMSVMEVFLRFKIPKDSYINIQYEQQQLSICRAKNNVVPIGY